MSISFVATGDYLQTRRVPTFEASPFKEVAELIHGADASVTNLELCISYNEGTPGPVPGGTHLQTTPDRLEDLVGYGFNLVGTANNHAFDYNYDGLALTRTYLDQYGILNTGTGDNLHEAEKPVYLDTLAGRVALLSATTPIHKMHMATEQRRDCIGRPGVNGLRAQKAFMVSPDDLEVLKRVARQTEVNAWVEAGIEIGLLQPMPETSCFFGTDVTGAPMRFTAGEPAGLVTEPNESDMRRIERTIDDARRQADYVIVSFHYHEMKGSDFTLAADYVPVAARRFIDAGAHAFIGHGPHFLRGIELYRNRPIFYSLGNFIFQGETVETLPQDFYDDNGIPGDLSVMQAMDRRTGDGTKGLGAIPEVMESVIPRWTMTDGELGEIVLHPIELGFGEKRHRRGFPVLTSNERILEYLAKLSAPFGTEIVINDGIGRIRPEAWVSPDQI